MGKYFFQPAIGMLLAAISLLAGCSPMTADAFRKNLIVFHDSIEVNRPYKEVADTLRKKTKECLNVDIKLVCTNCVYGGQNMGHRFWTPTFISNSERTEVHLQFKTAEQVGAPPKGDYEIVLDAIPLDTKRTKIDIYRLRPQEKFLQKAMVGWTRGETAGCPDLATIH